MIPPTVWTNPASVTALIDQQLALHPHMQVQDAYKLLYQGVLGSEHLLGIQPGAFEQRLRLEFDALEPDAAESLFEIIHPAGALRRVNLQPYKAQSGDLARLAAACLNAARQPRGTLADLQAVWALFVLACQPGRWPGLTPADAQVFTGWLEQAGFPAVHHSEIYRQAHRPAYRLVGAETF